MFFPLRDENPKETFPFVTIGLIIINVAIFILTLFSGEFEAIVNEFGIKPALFLREFRPEVFTLFTSMFLHGGILHIVGNMWYLWIFGDNIEDKCGHVGFLIFYLLSGLAAAFVHIWFNPSSMVPTIGASGAISGVLGAYFIRFPRAKVLALVVLVIYITTIKVPAFFLLGFWFIYQFLFAQLSVIAGATSIAYWAHVGGFVAGILLFFVFRRG
ncbi:MAG: rhomboid family intramembrane serine protease [Euryarchaeota archaeon]|nr:rhomboid family intramembrane serine protease [Euryarchaeota archaeon]